MDPKMEEEARRVEMSIADSYKEPNMSKVLNVRATPAVPPGENFLSIIWRLEVKILLNNGDVQVRNVILKKLPGGKLNSDIVKLDVFKREIITYELVLTKMDEIMREFNFDSERSWCNLILHNNYEDLLLEDLKPLGYETADKIKGLTLQEAELVLQSLGRFHAASKAAVHQDLVKISDLKPRMTSKSPTFVKSYFVGPVRFLAQAIDESWGHQWKGIAEKLDKPAEEIVNKILKAGEVDETKFNTVLHGDLWTNNILFQKDECGEPKSVKFVDFQLSFYNTIAWDLTYFAFTSLSYDLRKHHLSHLLKIYLEILQDDLRRYGYPEEKIPTYEYLQDEMKRLRFWGLMTITLYVPLILTGVTGNKEDAEILMDPSLQATKTPQIFQSEIYRDTVGNDVLELVNEGVMD